MKNKLKIVLVGIIILLVILIVFTIALNQTGVIKRIADNINKEEVKKEISYEVYKHVDGKTAILVIVEDTENGIDKIMYPDNEMELSCNGKTKVAFDYNTDITGKDSLTFKAINTKGEEIEKTILINDQFYLNMIDYSLVNETETQKALTVDYKEGSTTKQYKVGDNSAWVNYGGTIRLDDYQILETLENENREVRISLRQVDKLGYEIVVESKLKYKIDENVKYKEEDTIIEGESILACVENNTLESGNYIFKVTGTTKGNTTETIEYPIELYNYDDDATYIGQNYTVIENTAYIGMGKISPEKRMLILKYNGNLTVNEGVTITPTGTNENINGATYLCTKKGMFIYCAGTLTNNGTISMTAKGTVNQVGENVYLYKNLDNTYEYVPAIGENGGASATSRPRPYRVRGNSGISGNNRSTAGGGSGGVTGGENHWANAFYSGAGGTGSSYSGGAGGGGTSLASSGYSGSSTGGAGGNGHYRNWGIDQGAGGGAGNPGGIGTGIRAKYRNGDNGTGGLLIISADTIMNDGAITSNGASGGAAFYGGAGGGSGGGSINLFYKTYISEGTITAAGGAGGGNLGMDAAIGGYGGNGSVTVTDI